MEDENSWVFDSLVCFLNGPIWNAPLQNFIEEKSLIFEPNVTESGDYKNIFDEFKNLVDFMLGNFMEDIGISPEQFENACKEGKKYHLSFDHNLFEQIWAANDYEMFKKMMTQRNVELQLQALELIERKYGITPQSFIPKDKGDSVKQMPVAVEQNSQLENDVMDEVAKTFSTDEPSSSVDVQNILEQKQDLEKTLQEAKEKTIATVPSEKDAKEGTQREEKPKKTFRPESPKVAEKAKEVDALELKKRQEYLRAQRDKLVALKKEARKKQLTAETDDSKEKPIERPRSAKAAKAMLTGEKPNIEPQQLLIRKTLAERLKSEVVNKELK